MSLADHEIEEPDEAFCTIHLKVLPCPHCRDEQADRDFDTMRDRTLERRAQRAERRRQS